MAESACHAPTANTPSPQTGHAESTDVQGNTQETHPCGDVSPSEASRPREQTSATHQLVLTDRTQCLRLETIRDSESRRAILVLKLSIMVGVLSLIALTVIKERPQGEEWIVLNQNFVIVQVAVNGALLAALLGVYCAWGYRIAQSYRHGMTWTNRRAAVVRNSSCRAFLTSIIISGQLAMNLFLLADPSTFCRSHLAQPLIDALMWLSWNTLLLILVVESHGMNLMRRPERPDGAVWDEPVTVHWPKLFVWVPFTGSVVWIAIIGVQRGHVIDVHPQPGSACDWGGRLHCSAGADLRTASFVAFACTAAYFLLYAAYLARAWRQLSRELYQKYRLFHMIVRLQVRVNSGIVLLLLIAITLTWYIGSNTCVNCAVTWFGNPCVSFTVVCLQMVSFNLTWPRSRTFLAAERTLPLGLLQQFAWTEADMPRRRASRRAAAAPGSAAHAALRSEPIFCFETAIKLFFWSVLVYAYAEGGDGEAAVSLAAMPAPILELLGEMDAAMLLLGLRKRRLFYDRVHGTKVLLAWSDSVILLSFRGTAERANLIQDANFLLTAHPPQRTFKGRAPRVHQGFLATWHAHGVHDAVLGLVRDLLAAAPHPEGVRVLCTGHSLGGAVAQLASFDIVRDLGVSPDRISCYTFGCPRLGNHALAEEFEEVVPDTWHIINDQDVVTRGMKLMGMYKRAGHRVIINTSGHLIVRPGHFELSMLQHFMHGGDLADHKTVAYQRALFAVVTAQLRDSSRHDDGLHGLLGLLKQVPQVRTALEEHARRDGTSFANIVRSLASNVRHATTAATAGAAAIGGAAFSSQRFTPSRHASLLRAAGAERGWSATAASGGLPSPPCSPASTVVSVTTEPALVVIDEDADGGLTASAPHTAHA